jgi:iron(III) transport system substrate-binding protein
MRRYFFLILFVVVLVTPFILRRAVGTDPAGSQRTAAGGRRLVVITPHNEGIRREFQDGFSDWLKTRGEPDVHLDYRSFGGGASDIVKYFDSSKELYASIGTYRVDLVWGGGDDLFERQLKGPGYLQQVTLPTDIASAAYPTPDIGGMPLYDRAGYWYGTALSSFGIVYNKDVLRYLGLPEPKTWADLADPRYRRWLVLADPTRSASAETTFMVIVERAMADAAAAAGFADTKAKLDPAQAAARSAALDKGWQHGMGLVRMICANTRVFADASGAVPGIVGSGDAAAGMAIDFYGRTQVEAIGEHRLGYVEPVGATIINPDPIAVARREVKTQADQDQLALAVRFIEYVLSPEGQKLWNYKVGTPGGPRSTSLRRLPIRPSVYADTTNFTDKVNPFTTAAGFNTRKDRTDTKRFLGPMIQASCIDLLDELRGTRRAIEASPRAAELTAKLAEFPFGEVEAKARLEKYKAASPIVRLGLMRQWTRAFADEYAGLRAAAKQ